MRIDSGTLNLLEKEMGKKLTLVNATNNKFLLPAGDYIVEMALQDGTKKTKKFCLREAARTQGAEPITEEEEY
jgi:hypothetical protein